MSKDDDLMFWEGIIKAKLDASEKVDMVNHPPHYQGKIEVIDVLEDKLGREGFEKYCIGNSLKYLMRYENKGNPLQDLEKAAWYLNKAIEKRKDPK